MNKRTVFIACLLLCCALVVYESLAQTMLFDHTAELMAIALRSRANRPSRTVSKPMTLAMVRKSLENDRGAERMRAVLEAKRFITDNPDLIPLLVKIYVGRKTGHRTAAAAEMVIQTISHRFERCLA